MIQSSRFLGSVPAAAVSMFGFMNSQDSSRLQLLNMNYMKDVVWLNHCSHEIMIPLKNSLQWKERLLHVNMCVFKGEEETKRREKERVRASFWLQYI